HEVRIAELTQNYGADHHGLEVGQKLYPTGLLKGTWEEALASDLLYQLADPNTTNVRILADGKPLDLRLHHTPKVLAAARSLSERMPRDPIKAIAVILGFLIFLSVFGNVV